MIGTGVRGVTLKAASIVFGEDREEFDEVYIV